MSRAARRPRSSPRPAAAVSRALARAALLASLGSPLAAVAQSPDGPGGPDGAAAAPECRCRMPGGSMRDLGAVECLEIGARRVPVRCEMSTNTPYWRTLDGGARGCPAPA